jgi:hypothetical protein
VPSDHAGAIVDVGQVAGRVAGVDPGGRYVAVARDEALTIHDAGAALKPVMSCAAAGPFHDLAVHPGGESVAVLGEDLTVELWRSDGTVRRLPGGGAAGGSDWTRRGWLQFTADGSYLLFGDTVSDGARLSLLDAATLARLDGVPALQSAGGETLIEHWGEGVEATCAAAPSTAVAFAACSGDNTLVLAVAEVVEDRLRLYGAVPGRASFAVDLPGERVMGLAPAASGELAVLDSDDFLSVVRWRDPTAGTRRLGEPSPSGVNGPVFTRGRLVAMAVEEERLTAGRLDWQPVGLVILNLRTGEWLGRLDLPGAERHEPIFLTNGIVHQRIGERTRISRWV